MRKVSLERYYFVLYDCALTSKMAIMALKSFCDKTLHIFTHSFCTYSTNQYCTLLIRNCCTGKFAEIGW